MDEIYEFYNKGAEIGRLERGLGIVEFHRTKEILSRYIGSRNVVYDIGGGIGLYSAWLAKQGNEVHLIELAETAVNYAKENLMNDCSFVAETGNALSVDRPNQSADIVLLMGPQYHLQKREERMKSLSEAMRVLKPGGLLVVAGISKFSSMTWALSVYGEKNDFIDDPIYFKMIEDEMTTGNHNRPKEYPTFISEAYFTTAAEMESEVQEAGFEVEKSIAVEGCIWFTPHLSEKWNDEKSRERLLDIVRMTESEPEMMGMSPHFLTIACKKMKTVEVNGQSIAYQERGEGRPVLLIHGNGGSHHDLDTLANQLVDEGFKVFAPDSRGHGENAPLKEYHYADMAEDMFQFCCALNIEKPIIYGWSDGGIIALMLEMAHPGTAGRLVVSGVNIFSGKQLLREFSNTFFGDIDLSDPVAAMMYYEPNIEVSDLNRIMCPVLVTAGENDLIPEPHTRLIADNLPNSELLILPDHDHFSYIVGSKVIGKIVIDFINRKQ